jgi:hypothetical protein
VTGHLSYDGPDFYTTLIRGDHFLSLAALTACQNQTVLPLLGLVFRGRNGVLISPTMDPQTQEEVDPLFASSDRL